jgi:hypothetical protein
LRCIREYRGVDEGALQQVLALPECHPNWNCSKPIDPLDACLDDDPTPARTADEAPQ